MAGDEVGRELYVYDPLTETTTLLADLNQGADSGMVKLWNWSGGSTGGSSSPADLTVIDGKLYFSAEGNNQTDGGRRARTLCLRSDHGRRQPRRRCGTDPDLPKGGRSGGPVVIDGHIYFTADVVNPTDGNLGQELYVIDTATDTGMPVTDLATGPANSAPSELTVIDGKIYFSAKASTPPTAMSAGSSMSTIRRVARAR